MAQQANALGQAAQEKMSQMQREREAELDRMQEALNRVVETRRTPNGMVISLPNSVFRGYTDDVGSAEYNQQLSMRRAAAVKNYLVQAGIDAGIVNVKGYGKTSPLLERASNDARASKSPR